MGGVQSALDYRCGHERELTDVQASGSHPGVGSRGLGVESQSYHRQYFHAFAHCLLDGYFQLLP